MKGYGWKCDHCGKGAVKPEDYGRMQNVPPPGWFIVNGPFPENVNEAVNYDITNDLCSTECLEKFAYGLTDL